LPEYFSYAEQTAHYFNRAHSKLPTGPISCAAAWKTEDFESDAAWRFRLSALHIAELEEALAVAGRTGKASADLQIDDFPLPTLAPEIARWREEIDNARGFQVVSGVPTQDWSRKQTETFFWCLGLHMGRPGAQNLQGDLLGEVRDTGQQESDPYVRLYQTRSEIAFHCDAADVVGLLCLQSADKGGLSRIASSVTIYNAVRARRPDLADRLFEPLPLDIRETGRDAARNGGLRSIEIAPCRFSGQRLRTFYHSDYFRSAQRHSDVPPFSEDERALLDLYEEIAADPEIRLEMPLEPGDIQWLSNHSIVHARTGYQDNSDPASRRELLRLWLSLQD
jgi:hypothetical protein